MGCALLIDDAQRKKTSAPREEGMEWSVNRGRWRKQSPRNDPIFYLSALLLLILLSIVVIHLSSSGDLLLPLRPLAASSSRPSSSSPAAQESTPTAEKCAAGFGDERYLWYAPHSGFSNQVAELKNAVLMAGILNRTLIVPPVLDHQAISLGSCPKFRVTGATQLRAAVWDHIMQLMRERRYVSIGNIIDLSSVSMVRTIDFRVFASKWCGLHMKFTCFGGLCCTKSDTTPLESNYDQCRSLLSSFQDNIQCVYAVEDDCRTTVWTYQQSNDDMLDSFQPSKELQNKKRFSYVRKRKDVLTALGHGSNAELSRILAFGSLFSAPYKGSELYIDIHRVPSDPRIQSLLHRIEFLPFVSEIVTAGKDFALKTIRKPFLCAQLRLLDGQFKNHWEATFSALKQKLRSLELELKEHSDTGPIHIFVMTDLPKVNWTGTYLSELAEDKMSYKLHVLPENSAVVAEAAEELVTAAHITILGFLPKECEMSNGNRASYSMMLPDIRLYVEETICSCASLGFVGTAGSTIAENIELMRKGGICSK